MTAAPAVDVLHPARLRGVLRLLGVEAAGPTTWLGDDGGAGLVAAFDHHGPLDAAGPPAGLVVAWPGPGARPEAEHAAWWAQLAACLTEGGVAAVHLDLLPGWHPLTAVQDFARFHASQTGLPLDAALREVLALADELLGADEGRWNGWLGRVRDLLADAPEAVWALPRGPVEARELHAWVDLASGAGLRFLGDAVGPNHLPLGLPAPMRAWIDDEVRRADDPLRGAQIADYATNRHARIGLFVKGTPAPAAGPVRLVPAHHDPRRWQLEPVAVPPHEAPEAARCADLTAGEVPDDRRDDARRAWGLGLWGVEAGGR